MDYRPPLTDQQEHQEELEYAVDEVISYLGLAIDSVRGFKELDILCQDLKTMQENAKDEQKEIIENGKLWFTTI